MEEKHYNQVEMQTETGELNSLSIDRDENSQDIEVSKDNQRTIGGHKESLCE